ncbi:hypothetical protein [Schleiferilactobacillus harbinensis]|uniref:hypothetical protein n=1 Tax=Schleiferilactobacillus harbinensis TaxID=304207 RepID=UPI001166E0F8|nr:hypothetical protein [Schleiferilactobacillus harbinensis]GEK06650.1 hypothetical protein LHA01_18890 [Schleiferilactobacillus harbinensis]
MAETDVDVSQVSNDLLNELNLDQSELGTIQSLVSTAQAVVSRSTDASSDDSLTIPAIKTLATATYYDRTLSNGMPNGLLMMLTHLQSTPANPSASQSGDSNGN